MKILYCRFVGTAACMARRIEGTAEEFQDHIRSQWRKRSAKKRLKDKEKLMKGAE